jgi:hypothetical protein
MMDGPIWRSSFPALEIVPAFVDDEILDATAQQPPARPAVIDTRTGRRITFGQFVDGARRVASGLRRRAWPRWTFPSLSNEQRSRVCSQPHLLGAVRRQRCEAQLKHPARSTAGRGRTHSTTPGRWRADLEQESFQRRPAWRPQDQTSAGSGVRAGSGRPAARRTCSQRPAPTTAGSSTTQIATPIARSPATSPNAAPSTLTA